MTLDELKKEIPTIKQKLESGEYRVVSIDGPQGPTGKTTAANLLRSEGIPVYEEWQLFNIWVGWNTKQKSSVMSWNDFVENSARICDVVRNGYYGYQAVLVGGTYRADDVVDFLGGKGVDAFCESKVLRITLSTYSDRTTAKSLP